MLTTACPVGRPFARLRFVACLALALCSLPVQSLAQQAGAQQAGGQQEGGQFDLVLTGITAAKLDFSASQQGDSYVVTAGFASTGLLAMLRRVRFEARAEGVIRDGLPRPARYEARAEAGKRSGETVMDYVDGLPQLRVDNPPREAADWQIAASTQGGTVDPISALYIALRDVVPGAECSLSFRMFDGRRATELTIGPSRPEAGGGVTCAGEYRRIAGYPPEDMAERTRFPFTLIYLPTESGQLRVVEVTMDSLLGKARLVRR